ncbi:SDR family NAD(P)-dependent oxidoreductase [Reyranella sp.]|uniref:SDR family NAD(P)-dependent oxidoreductase n=1 Tax=Reyranella sp. TaxID=1929291 RepID=UPI003D14EF60
MTASGPVALLVGAGDAIGAAVARRFAAGGMQVCVARRDAGKARALIDEVAARGGSLRAFSVDARQEGSIQDLFAKIEGEVGPIDACLYNAGSNVNTPLLDTSESLFRKAWELACYGGFLTGREAARYMVPRGRGTILFTGATASVRGGSGFAAFASAKFGLRAVAQSMARELGPGNIHVAHLLVDGGVDSNAIRKRMRARIGDAVDSLPTNTLIRTEAIADAYWMLHTQPTWGWTHELDLRTSIERW